MKQITLHYSESLIRHAVQRFWIRVVGWRFLIAVVLVLVGLVTLVASGDRSWFVGALGAVLLLGITFAAALYVVHYRDSVGRFRRLSKPEATFELGADGFRMASDAGRAEIPWRQVREIWRFPEFWLIFLTPAQFITLPAADLDDESSAYLLDRVHAHGGRIV